MRKIILLLTFIFITSCKKNNEENKKIDTSNIEVDNNLSSIHFLKDSVGYYDNFEKVKKITFQEVEESEYLKLETQKTIEKNEDLIIDKKGITIKGTNLVSEIGLKNSKNKEFEYLGYYPSLNLYALSENSTSEGLSFSDFIYLNLKDKKLTKIVSSNSDSKIEDPVISIKNNFLAYYCNTLYETNNSFLGVLKIEGNNKLTEFAYFETEEYKIQDIKWDNK
ncbi:hypothetical protein BWK59_14755, partial [Flavobacterium davisii]